MMLKVWDRGSSERVRCSLEVLERSCLNAMWNLENEKPIPVLRLIDSATLGFEATHLTGLAHLFNSAGMEQSCTPSSFRLLPGATLKLTLRFVPSLKIAKGTLMR